MCEDSILRMNANFSCLELVSLSNIHSTLSSFSTVSLCVIYVESIPHTITIDNRVLCSIIYAITYIATIDVPTHNYCEK